MCSIGGFMNHSPFAHGHPKVSKTLLIGGAIVGISLHIYQIYKWRQNRKKWNSAPKDVVVLHCTAFGNSVPNLSPYTLKLETYLRMADIKYEIDSLQPFGPKQKFPWITINGQDFSDSELIINMLNQKFRKNFSSNLSAEDRSAAHAISVMTDERTSKILIWTRMIREFPRFAQEFNMPFFLRLYVPRWGRNHTWHIGIGRNSDDEIHLLAKKDFEALSNYLGNKQFMMGDTPSEVDCCVFGTIANIIWTTSESGPLNQLINDNFSNLREHSERMRDMFWPDWQEKLRQH